MECRKQLCEKCKKKEDDYFLVTPYFLSCALMKSIFVFSISLRLLDTSLKSAEYHGWELKCSLKSLELNE